MVRESRGDKMNARTNTMNSMRLNNMHLDLFDMANSYAGDKYGAIAVQIHHLSNLLFDVSKILKPLFSEPDKVKPLAQYLDEYIQHEEEIGNIEPDVGVLYAWDSWYELLKQALDAYESTEQVKIKIERV